MKLVSSNFWIAKGMCEPRQKKGVRMSLPSKNDRDNGTNFSSLKGSLAGPLLRTATMWLLTLRYGEAMRSGCSVYHFVS